MELMINDKIYSFRFGVKFVRELDKNHAIEREGIRFGMGLAAKILPELKTANIATLADILYIANRTESPKLNQGEIDDFIDNCEDLESVFDMVLKEITESNTGKLINSKMSQ